MSRDMKPRKAAPARKSAGGTLLGLFIGLVIGVVAVAAVVWYINKVPLPFTTTGQPPAKVAPTTTAKAPAAAPETQTPSAPAPIALPGKPGDPVGSDKPRLDFYKILPGKAEAIPDPAPAEHKPLEAKPAEAKPPASKPEATTPSAPASSSPAVDSKPVESKPVPAKPSESKPAETKHTESSKSREKADKEATALKEPIYLQAGAFQSASEADNQKARLALIGAEARIQQVMLQDKVWYRVRLGPFHKMDDVNHLRGDLARQGIDANVVKKD